MARILVIGSGFAGLSAAARLAKLRHEVTVLEREPEPGGRLLGLLGDDRRWTAGPDSVTLPGVFRDLFRKSGRTMDALIDISPTAGPRHHVLPARWPRRTVAFDLPFGTRGAQHDAVTAALGADGWSGWVDELADPWNSFRREVLEVVHDESAPRSPLDSSLRDFVRPLRDPRLRRIAADLAGVDPDRSPAVLAVWHYVERNFGRWNFDGGTAGLAAALVTRLGERKVTIETGTSVELVPGSGPVDGVVAGGSFRPADLVVWAGGEDPTTPAPMPTLALTAVRLDGAALPDDLVVHGRDTVRGWRSGDDGWVLQGPPGVDPLDVLAGHGFDVRSAVASRTALPPSRALTEVPRPARTPRAGLWLVGSAATPGLPLELTGEGTAALAAHLGAVPR